MKRRKIIFTLLLLFYAGLLAAQTVSGVVCDSRNKEPIPGVMVYFDETTIHSITDAQGRYELHLKQQINAPLVFRHLTYDTYVFNDRTSALPDTVFLSEKVNLMESIIVRRSTRPRETLMKAFRTHFLGSSPAGKSCVIRNEDDIHLVYDEEQKQLSAYSDVPLIISNPFLGYEITYDLKRFTAKYAGTPFVEEKLSLLTVGNPLFKDISAPDDRKIKSRRGKAYENSPRQFFRMVYNADFGKSHYRFFNNPFFVDERMINNNADLTFRLEKDTDGLKKLHINTGRYNRKLWISYKGHLFTTFTFLDKSYLIDPYGNLFNELNILISGDMGTKRVGDKLPNDYLPEE